MLRKPKYLQSESAGRERWLISYTDIVTILLILFVAVAAQTLKARVEPARQSPPPQPRQSQSPERKPLVQAAERLKGHGLDVRLEAQGLVISLPQAILFPSGEDRIIPEAAPVVSQVADVLRDMSNNVVLVGHADSVPIHNQRFKNNWELSAARSLNLLALLTTQYGIPESRLSVQSHGSNSPKGSNETEDGRAENRRVEILILDEAGVLPR